MSLKDAQRQVDDWVQQFKLPYWQPLSILAAIQEELGELALTVNNMYGGRVKKQGDPNENIGEELTDLIFDIICMANSHKIDLDEEWKKKIDKCYGRDNQRYERKA